jgi:multiple sugar transport system substrate-binding protein
MSRATLSTATHRATTRNGGIVRTNRLIPAAAAGLVTALVVAVAVSIGGAGTAAASSRDAGNVVFLSNQLAQVTETDAVRNIMLKKFPGNVDYTVPPVGQGQVFFNRVQAEAQAGKGTISLLGALHGDYLTIQQYLTDLTPLAKTLSKNIPADLMKLGKLGTNKQLYVPWMQATYIMVANKKALPYLPKGADYRTLTYGQLFQWAKNMADKTGGPKLAVPAGTNGLMPRFFEGYLVPSYSGGVVTSFRSQGAIAGWLYLKTLWKYVHPQSLSYSFMQDPLLSGEVWVAWDHVARLVNALKSHPEDYVAFPAPKGPKGRGYMPVLAGLAIPKTAPNAAGARQLITWMDSISTQAKILGSVGFFPVVSGKLSEKLGPGLLKMNSAVRRAQGSKDSLKSLLPIGLGAEGGNFNKVYVDTFTRIVLKGEDIKGVLDDEGKTLQALMDKTGAHCWAPDPPSSGACQVK